MSGSVPAASRSSRFSWSWGDRRHPGSHRHRQLPQCGESCETETHGRRYAHHCTGVGVTLQRHRQLQRGRFHYARDGDALRHAETTHRADVHEGVSRTTVGNALSSSHVSPDASGKSTVYAIRSTGRDGLIDGNTYTPGAFSDPDNDIVFSNGNFVAYPDVMQSK